MQRNIVHLQVNSENKISYSHYFNFNWISIMNKAIIKIAKQNFWSRKIRSTKQYFSYKRHYKLFSKAISEAQIMSITKF